MPEKLHHVISKVVQNCCGVILDYVPLLYNGILKYWVPLRSDVGYRMISDMVGAQNATVNYK